jgi:hypothetical protein
MKSELGFLLIHVGGFGGRVASKLKPLLEVLEVPGCRLVVIDTADVDIQAARDVRIDAVFHLTPDAESGYGDRLEDIQRHPEVFGRRDPMFFVDFGSKNDQSSMDALGVNAGAGTRPEFGEFLFEAVEWSLTRFLRGVLDEALTESQYIQAVIIGSGGGGTSAPCILRIAELLGTDGGLARCCNQSPDRVKKPWVVTLPPLIQSKMAENQTFAQRPLANAYAFTHELNVLGHCNVVEYVFRLNSQNGQGCAVSTLDSAATLVADFALGLVIGANNSSASWCDTLRIVRYDPARRGVRTK